MNSYMEMSIKACIGYLDSFVQGMRVAALKDDSIVSRDEEKILKKLNKTTEKYKRELDSLLDD